LWSVGLGGLAALAGATALSASAVQNPYQEITERNVFNLRPPPAPGEPPKVEPGPLTLTGISTFGVKRALIMLAGPPGKTNSHVKAQSVMLGEGQREGGLEVLHINEKNRTVTVNDSGTITTLGFAPTGNSPAPRPQAAPAAPAAPAANPFEGALRRAMRAYAPQ
jgi:hypothetical protein